MNGLGDTRAVGPEAIVALGVQDSGTGAHSLRESAMDDPPGVPSGILVNQRSAEHPRHDLGVAVLMSVETVVGFDDVVVVHQQKSMRVRGVIEVSGEGETVTRREPAVVEMRAFVSSLDDYRRHVSSASRVPPGWIPGVRPGSPRRPA